MSGPLSLFAFVEPVAGHVAMILLTDPDLDRYLKAALKVYARFCHDNGAMLPEPLERLYTALSGTERKEIAPVVSPWSDDDMKLFLTYEEAADRLNVSERTVRNYARAGKLKVVSLGRARRIRPSDLEAFAASLEA